MNDINNVQAAAAMAAGASIVGGVAGLKLAYGRPRRAAVAQAARQARTQRRFEAAMDQRAQTPKVRPAARVVQQANRAAASVAPMPRSARMDVGTLEELLAGLFSLRNDLNTLADELAAMRDKAA